MYTRGTTAAATTLGVLGVAEGPTSAYLPLSHLGPKAKACDYTLLYAYADDPNPSLPHYLPNPSPALSLGTRLWPHVGAALGIVGGEGADQGWRGAGAG